MVEKFGNSFCFTTEAFITVNLLKKVLICCQHLGFLSFSGKALKNDSRHNVKRDFVKKMIHCRNSARILIKHFTHSLNYCTLLCTYNISPFLLYGSQARKPIILNYLWVSLFQTGLFQEFFLLDEALKSKEMSRIPVSKPGNQQIAPCSPGISGVAQKLHCFCTYLCKALHYFPLILALFNWSPNMISQFNILKIYYAFHFIFTAAYCMGRNSRKTLFLFGYCPNWGDSPAQIDLTL